MGGNGYINEFPTALAGYSIASPGSESAASLARRSLARSGHRRLQQSLNRVQGSLDHGNGKDVTLDFLGDRHG